MSPEDRQKPSLNLFDLDFLDLSDVDRIVDPVAVRPDPAPGPSADATSDPVTGDATDDTPHFYDPWAQSRNLSPGARVEKPWDLTNLDVFISRYRQMLRPDGSPRIAGYGHWVRVYRHWDPSLTLLNDRVVTWDMIRRRWVEARDDMVAFTHEILAEIAPTTGPAQWGSSLYMVLRDRLTVERAPWDVKSIVAFRNGALDMDTGEFRDVIPEDYCSIVLPCDYVPGRQSEIWDQYIRALLPDEPDRLGLMQWVGNMLTRDVGWAHILVLVGPSAMVYLFEAMMRLLEGSVATQSFRALASDPVILTMVQAEILPDADYRLDPYTDVIRWMTQWNPVTVPVRRGKAVPFQLRAKTLVGMDRMPQTTESNRDFLDRIRVIRVAEGPWVEFPRDDVDWDVVLSAMATAAIQAYREVRGGRLEILALKSKEPQSKSPVCAFETSGATAKPIDPSVEAFLSDSSWVVRDHKGEIVTEDLHYAYQQWCVERAYNPIDQKAFGGALTHLGFKPHRPKVSGKLKRGYKGLRMVR